MRLIIAGSRSITDESVVREAFEESQFEWDDVDAVVCGMADGVDSIAVELAEENGVPVIEEPYEEYLDDVPDDVSVPEKVAPLLRNTRMAEKADALLAVKEGESSGTEDMIEKARRHNLVVEVENTEVRSLSDFT